MKEFENWWYENGDKFFCSVPNIQYIAKNSWKAALDWALENDRVDLNNIERRVVDRYTIEEELNE